MDSLIAGTVMPGLVGLVFLLVFAYLQRQSSERYFFSWQWFWAAATLQYAFLALIRTEYSQLALLPQLFQLGGVLALYHSVRGFTRVPQYKWSTPAVLIATALWAVLEALAIWSPASVPRIPGSVSICIILLVTCTEYARVAYQRDSMGLRWMAGAIGFWIALLASGELPTMAWLNQWFGLAPLMLLGTTMIVVIFDDERRVVQDNALGFSALEVDSGSLITADLVRPSVEKLLERLMQLLKLKQAVLYIAEPWRGVLPCVQKGFGVEFLRALQENEAGDCLSDLAFRRGGLATIRSVDDLRGPLRASGNRGFSALATALQEAGVTSLSAVCLQTRDRNMGVFFFPHPKGLFFAAARIRLLLSVGMQIGMTLENYLLVHDAQRRTKEYELLTQIGQVISSRLDPDEVLKAVHRELGLLFDTSNFYVAFLDGAELRYDFEVVRGIRQPKRTRHVKNGLSEFVIRTAQPVLIRSEMRKITGRLGIDGTDHPASCYIAVPIHIANVSCGVMAALNFEREFAYEQRDVEVLQTAAGQVAVAIENARLFAQEQRRARYLSFLNNVSRTAISSQNAEEMLDEIVHEIQKNFNFDHIGIGILDYASKEIEIKAEAGTTAHAKGRRVALGVGVLGRVARTGETSLVQNTEQTHLSGILPDSRSALCIPVTYAETLLGVLNVESRRENAFSPEETLILQTLADLLATALHNAFVFQKMQQQSITDGLTGIKTRRYFLEATQSEWKRASRSARRFSVVMVDLDKFKEVNDTLGHLEGDLVLARIARLLEQKCRQSNVVARYGGDEFVILMPETGLEQAEVLAERLRLWIANDPMMAEHHVTGSFGVATYPLHGSTVEDIMRVADAGMYLSKREGGNRVSIAEQFAEDQQGVVQRRVIQAYVEGFLQREHTGPEYTSELLLTLKRFAETEANEDRAVMMDAILALNHASESRELYAAGHGEMVARYTEQIANELGIHGTELEDLTFAAKIHDVGKIVLPEKLLNKPGLFTGDEYYLMKMHCIVGAEIVDTIPNSANIRQIVRYHHEWFDGSGYPEGLKGEQIPLGSRIIAVAEAYASMLSDVSFHPARTQADALRELESLSGSQFDGMLVRILIRQFRSERAAQQQRRE